MKLLLPFGVGGKKIMAQGHSCQGRVTHVTPCYWLKVNTKPIRAHAWDGAVYPHMVSFEYEADGCTCTGKRYYSWTIRPPVKGGRITVYYDEKDPSRYAVLPKFALCRFAQIILDTLSFFHYNTPMAVKG